MIYLSKDKNKGITLIALVITIIVLLILAGITINTIISNDSPINKASEAKIQNELAEIDENIKFAIIEINTKCYTEGKPKSSYYETKDKFIEEGKLDTNTYEIKNYSYDNANGKVTLVIKKKNGTGTEFTFEIDINTNQVTCTSHQTSLNPSGGSQGDEQGGGQEQSLNPTQEEIISPDFYVCDNNGNRIENQAQFKNWFDKNLSTAVSRNSYTPLKIKWDASKNIIGKQISVYGNLAGNSSFYIRYKDANGNTLSARMPNGYMSSENNLAYQSGESVTFVPEGAVELELCDGYGNYDIFEISLMEEGSYENNYLNNVQVVGLTSNKIGLKWEQDTSVQSVKVYLDGKLHGTVTNKEYEIRSGIKANMDYIVYLEPVTQETTASTINEKYKFNVTTPASQDGFYLENHNEVQQKAFANWFDGDTSTYVDINIVKPVSIKWTGNITGKQILVRANMEGNSSLYVKYKDTNGNVLNAVRPDGTIGDNMIYQNGDSVTYVPEGAVSLDLYDNYNPYNIYDIKVFEEGTYWTNEISNINATNIGTNSVEFSWNKTSKVIKTKIYQDGVYIGETEGTTYSVPSGLLSNTEYKYSFEAITEYTTDDIKHRKISKTITTQSDGADIYIDGTDNRTRKRYRAWFDKDDTTYVNRSTSSTLKLKWEGNLTGKKISIRTNFER